MVFVSPQALIRRVFRLFYLSSSTGSTSSGGRGNSIDVRPLAMSGKPSFRARPTVTVTTTSDKSAPLPDDREEELNLRFEGGFLAVTHPLLL